MSLRAWAYVWGVLLAGLLLATLSFVRFDPALIEWSTFATFTLLATGAHFFEAAAPKRHSYYPSYVFFFAGVLLLPPALFVLLVTVPHLTEWVKARLVNSPNLRNWYIQPFNIAMHVIAGLTASWMQSSLLVDPGLLPLISPVLAMTLASLTYVLLNNALLGLALVLARGISWRDSGVLELENLLSELIMLCLGYVVAVLWRLNHWLILPALSPLGLMYRALQVPQLIEQARTDSKTGLWNARHFDTLFQAELERATRFSRPVAFIMADLDLLRDINNTYGHLAGDIVLTGIGTLLRSTIRDYDIAGRFGGEEFAIVMPEVGPSEARALAERIRLAIQVARFEVATSPTPISATMSLGVACFPSDATSATELIHEADAAVYQAKHQGRNRVVCACDVPLEVKLALKQAAHQSAAGPAGQVSSAAPAPSSAVEQRFSGSVLRATTARLLILLRRIGLLLNRQRLREMQQLNQQLMQTNQELSATAQTLQQRNADLLRLLANTLDTRNPGSAGHAARVAAYATAVAVELGLAPERIVQLQQAALLHDLGKLGIAEELLHTAAPLDELEYGQIKAHATLGAAFLESSPGLRHLASFVRHHHERWDGTGYPAGLRGAQIPLEARILALCETLETLLSPQPYRAAQPLAEALAEIERCAATQFDPLVVAALGRVVACDGDVLFHSLPHPPLTIARLDEQADAA